MYARVRAKVSFDFFPSKSSRNETYNRLTGAKFDKITFSTLFLYWLY